MDVSIIVIHYNTPDLTRQCLASIMAKTKGIFYEVIVVDNASTVHDPTELTDAFPEIKLIRSKTNLGFAGGNNLGIKHARGKYILLLNSDTVLLNNAVKIAFEYMAQTPDCGVVSGQLQYPDGRIQSVCQRFPSIKYSFLELLRIQKLLSKEQRGKLLLGAFFDHQSTVRVDWVWGAFFMLRQEVIEKLPGKKLDDRYFMYAEDMQWCLDIKKLGYEIHYYPAAKLIHFMGGSSGKKNELMVKNNQRFLRDNFSSFEVKIITILQKTLARNGN